MTRGSVQRGLSVRIPNPTREKAAKRLMSASEREPSVLDSGATRDA
jgi:hypothetical protein